MDLKKFMPTSLLKIMLVLWNYTYILKALSVTTQGASLEILLLQFGNKIVNRKPQESNDFQYNCEARKFSNLHSSTSQFSNLLKNQNNLLSDVSVASSTLSIVSNLVFSWLFSSSWLKDSVSSPLKLWNKYLAKLNI